jgi:hypothetical protein
MTSVVDDDVLPVDIDQAVLTGCVPPQALLHHGDLRRGDELRHDLAEEDLGVGIFVDLVPLGDRPDEFPSVLLENQYLGLPVLVVPAWR